MYEEDEEGPSRLYIISVLFLICMLLFYSYFNKEGKYNDTD